MLNYFCGKNLVLRFSGQKSSQWARNDVFQIFLKIAGQSFFDFIGKVIARPKIVLKYIFGNKSYFKDFWSKIF